MRRNYDDPVYKEVRKRVLKRDKHKCQMPDCKKRRRLNVHHIERWADAASLRYETFNMITLCRTCHDSIKDKESHYVPLFMDIVRKNENNKRH